jgi:TRAP-type mannitol/chloroaromatic compound transport system permease small subunit
MKFKIFKNTYYLISRSSIVLLVSMLWGQWPYRVFFGSDARAINDVGQIAFAFFVVTAFTEANLHQTHLRVNSDLNNQSSLHAYEWLKYLFILPWVFFILYSAWPIFINSLMANEKFPDSYTSGFYFIKFALLLLPMSFLFLSLQLLIKVVRDKF